MNQPKCEKIEKIDEAIHDLPQWLEKQARTYDLKYLLAHADDGVVWGKFDQTYALQTSDQAFPKKQLASLRIQTLQQCRAFGQKAEVMLWRSGDNWQMAQSWQARVINDVNCSEQAYIPESQMLWGTQSEATNSEFTLVADGSEGLRHAVPLINIPFSDDRAKLDRPLRLNVRHYIHYDLDGIARIYLSRLVELTHPQIKEA